MEVDMVRKVSLCLTIALLLLNKSYAQDDSDFLKPPQIHTENFPEESYSSETRKFSGISSLAVSPEGRMWAVWYAGPTPGEDLNNYVVVATSGDKGETWKEVLIIDPDGPGKVRAFDPEAWIDPDGKLWIFWAQHSHPARSTSSGVWAITTINPEKAEAEWSKPRRLVDGVMMCKPVVLTNQAWVLPVSYWHLWENSAGMVVSKDKGETWEKRGAVNVPKDVRNHDEHMLVEKKNGTLWMLVRTTYGIGESTSTDGGQTWSPLIPSRIQHPAARFFISRLNSGNQLMVKHGPIDIKTGRSHLMAFVSKDDGFSWSDGLLLDQRPSVSYPDGQQDQDGTIYITYDYSRTKQQEIFLTSFTENDVVSGNDSNIVEVFSRRQIISKGGSK